jgi:opacity protein-like surface antigen
MFTIRKLTPGALSLLLAAAAPASHAANEDNPWGLQVYAGDSLGMHGDFSKNHLTDIPDLGPFIPSLAGTPGSVAIETVTYDDMYKSRYNVGAELSYALSENAEAYGRFGYNALTGKTHAIGLVTSPELANSAQVIGHFNDTDTYSLMVGGRYYIPTGDSWRVFGGAALGGTRLHEMTGSLDIPEESMSLNGLRFARATTVFSQSVEAGIDYQSPQNLDLTLTLGGEHMGAPRAGNDPQLAALGFDTTHEGDARWSFPLTLGATYRF